MSVRLNSHYVASLNAYAFAAADFMFGDIKKYYPQFNWGAITGIRALGEDATEEQILNACAEANIAMLDLIHGSMLHYKYVVGLYGVDCNTPERKELNRWRIAYPKEYESVEGYFTSIVNALKKKAAAKAE